MLIYDLISISREKREKLESNKDYPLDYMPYPIMKELTEEEFKTSGFFTFVPNQIEFKTIESKDLPSSVIIPKESSLEMRVFWFGGKGLAIAAERPGRKIHYFECATCQHEYISKNIGRYYYEYTCKKCGDKYSVDSTD